jgi:hypothetical protein
MLRLACGVTTSRGPAHQAIASGFDRAGVDAYRTVCLAPPAEVVAVFEAVEKWAAYTVRQSVSSPSESTNATVGQRESVSMR